MAVPRAPGPFPGGWFGRSEAVPQEAPRQWPRSDLYPSGDLYPNEPFPDAATVVQVAGAATAAGGTNTPAVTPVASAGAATGAGGQQTPSVRVVEAAGTATASGGSHVPLVTAVQSAGGATADGVGNGASASYESEVLADNPTAYWRLGESSGTTMLDSSGNSHTGTYTDSGNVGAAPPALGAPGLLTSTADTGALFDLTTEGYVVLDDTLGTLGSSLGSLTVEFWWSGTTSTPVNVMYLRNTIGNFSGFEVDLNWDAEFNPLSGAVVLAVVDTTGNFFSAFSVDEGINDGQPHHVVFQVTDLSVPSAAAWIDGQSAVVTDASYNVPITSVSDFDGSLPLQIGASSTVPAPTNFLDGTLDEVALYPTQLSEARVQAHYDAGVAAPSSGTPPIPKVTVVQSAGAATAAGGANSVLTEEEAPADTTMVAPTGEAVAEGGANAVIPFEVPTVIRGGGQPTHLVTISVPPGEAYAEGGENRVLTCEIDHPRVRVHRRKRPQRQQRARLQATTTLHAPSGAAYAHAGHNGSRQVETVPLERILAQDAEFEELLILELI